MTIEIPLATYNGAAYLQQQLDSIRAQSNNNWRLLIRDDCSTDSTPEILNNFLRHNPGQVILLDNEGKRLGAKENFSELLARSTAPYVMFCDQDDVWLPHKIEATHAKMAELEAMHGNDKPLLVHTDLKVVADDLSIRADSLWNYQLSDPRRGDFLNKLLLQNVATGCSVMINRPLRDLALPIPAEAVMHDWWLVLTAAALGHIGYVAEPTALYRQHGHSEIGAQQWGPIRVIREYLDTDSRRSIALAITNQAAALLQRYEDMLPAPQREMLSVFVNLDRMNFVMRRLSSMKYGFYYTGLLRNIGRFVTM